MKMSDMQVGMAVRVKRGYSVRPAVVMGFSYDGKVHVRFTDIDAMSREAISRIPVGRRGNMFGAVVVPGAISEG